MTELAWLAAAFMFGAVVATAYLGALWLTVKRVQISAEPVRWLVVSLILRMALVFVAFYCLTMTGNGQGQQLIAALAGFIAIRTVALARQHRRGSA